MGNGGSGEPTAGPRSHAAVGPGATAAARAGRMVCVGELSRVSGSAVPRVMVTAVQGQPQHPQFVGWCSHSASGPSQWDSIPLTLGRASSEATGCTLKPPQQPGNMSCYHCRYDNGLRVFPKTICCGASVAMPVSQLSLSKGCRK